MPANYLWDVLSNLKFKILIFMSMSKKKKYLWK